MDQKAIDACARAAHEANRAYCIVMNDFSHADWDNAPDWQKDSARKGVNGALNGNTPEQSHDNWMAEKLSTGWQYGPVKDPVAKTHPCIVPYSELPNEQRHKDSIFLGVVRTMAAALAQTPL